ncbi:exonuclease domain-containing protein [Streptomyces sp. cg36]|uniref:exonuclease domain-containing protein n=1 Tax=Streptomyces sp. cg36 TaxID=3238798 RepID=UPI0034E1CF2E
MTSTYTGWPAGRLVAFNAETTGIDVECDRIVSAAIVTVGGGQGPEEIRSLLDPGVEIPAAATEIHGITTEQVRSQGQAAQEAIEEITARLAAHMANGTPLVVFNARFGLTVLDRECRRYGLVPLADRLPRSELVPVVDPLVIDKEMARYRRGSRKLPDLCRHWHVSHQAGHDAVADAFAAARLAWRLGTVFPRIGQLEPRGLHLLQIGWAERQAIGLQDYLRRTDPNARVDSAWPCIPPAAEGA